jgi:hypothetical protein
MSHSALPTAYHSSKHKIGIATFLFFLLLPLPLLAGTFTAFGPQNYIRGTGTPVTVTNSFSVLNPVHAKSL